MCSEVLCVICAEDSQRCDCAALEQVLGRLPGAERMVVGHTIQVNRSFNPCRPATCIVIMLASSLTIAPDRGTAGSSICGLSRYLDT